MRFVPKYLAILSAVCAATAKADDMPMQEALELPVAEYYILNQSVGAFLRTLERDTALRFQISPNVSGQLKGMSLSGETREVMNIVTASLGLEWYAFNEVIHVSAKSEGGTRVIRLGDLSAPQAIAGLVASGLPMAKFPAQVTGEGSALALSGPPTFLALAEAVIETIPEAQQVAAVAPPVRAIIVRRGVEVQMTPLNSEQVTTETTDEPSK